MQQVMVRNLVCMPSIGLPYPDDILVQAALNFLGAASIESAGLKRKPVPLDETGSPAFKGAETLFLDSGGTEYTRYLARDATFMLLQVHEPVPRQSWYTMPSCRARIWLGFETVLPPTERWVYGYFNYEYQRVAWDPGSEAMLGKIKFLTPGPCAEHAEK